MSRKIRVLVVDDSALMRKLIPQTLLRDPSIEVVGTAMDGLIGLKRIEDLHPDVVTLDLEMPRMDGMEMLRRITRKHRIPVIVFSARSEEGANCTLRALSSGAFDFLPKPQEAASGNLEQVAEELASRIKAAAASGAPKLIITEGAERKRPLQKPRTQPRRASHVVGIGVSTGGPNALQYLFSQLPEDFPGCLVVVQHMPEGFTGTFSRRLHESSQIEVKEAQSGDLLLGGRALICPGNRHIKVRRMERGDVVSLIDVAPVKGHRPSVDVLFQSLAEEFREEAAAVLMTGMGEDGVSGLGAVRAVGGYTIAQSPDTCVVDSMPKAAIERHFAMRVVSLDRLAGVLQVICASPTGPPDDLQGTSVSSESGAEEPAFRRRWL